ncbi:MAG TPA: hypothetical protein VJA46_07955 [Acidimicrobiia bacterium]|nr:hypothetical protein [Acidimicrobiia bacterium]
MHPFISYEIAKGMVEEMRAISEKRYWSRRAKREVESSPPSWDADVIQLMVRDNEGEQEKVGA